jgi:hypothetical protein
MAESLPRVSVEIRDFPGLVSKADADDIPVGTAAQQLNAMSTRPGELRVRPGYKVLTFEEN